MTLYTLDNGDRLDYFDKVKEVLIVPRVDNRPRQDCEENVREEEASSTQALDTELEVFNVKDTMPSDRTISNWYSLFYLLFPLTPLNTHTSKGPPRTRPSPHHPQNPFRPVLHPPLIHGLYHPQPRKQPHYPSHGQKRPRQDRH